MIQIFKAQFRILSYKNAVDNIDSITTYDLTNGTQLYVRLLENNCSNVFGPISINFTSPPRVISPLELKVEICDFNNDGVEDFDWANFLKDKVTTEQGVTIRVLIHTMRR